MALLRTHARVLRTYALGETSLIAVLLTAEAGLLRAVAKGARESRSRLRGLLQAGAALELQLYLKPRGGLHLLREASALGALPRPAATLEPLCLRLAALELVMCTTEEGEPLDGLYPLLDEYLELFAGEKEPGWAPFLAFEVGLLALHGVSGGADLDRCGLCGRPLDSGALRFLPEEGVFACDRHADEGLPLAPEEKDWLLSIFLARPAALAGHLPPAAVRARVGHLLHLALSRHLPGYRTPRSLAMLGGLPGPGEGAESAERKESP